jgi:unsaturated rhamnogalacturonyl hydrolase
MVKDYIDTYLKDFKSAKQDKWNYEDGCVLQGAIQLYKASGENRYKDFTIKYLDKYISNEGDVLFYQKESYNIDNISTGRALFFAYQETGNEKYRKAIEILMEQIRTHPRTKTQNFWHKKIYPNQIWLDGLYMAQPFYMMYETQCATKEHYKDIVNQFKNVREFLYNENKELYYHAYDEAKVQLWANTETGLSPNFWLRSMGWLLLALIDTLSEMDEQIYEYYRYISEMFKEAIKGILKYQDKNTKMFYQVIDKPDIEGNYVETSGSAMIACAILKACRMKVLLAEKYENIGQEILEGIIDNKLVSNEGKIELTGMCSVAGLGPDDKRNGSVEYYLSEPIVSDDQKGTGAFMMAYAEYTLNQRNK